MTLPRYALNDNVREWKPAMPSMNQVTKPSQEPNQKTISRVVPDLGLKEMASLSIHANGATPASLSRPVYSLKNEKQPEQITVKCHYLQQTL